MDRKGSAPFPIEHSNYIYAAHFQLKYLADANRRGLRRKVRH